MGLARLFGLCFALLFASSVGAAEVIDLGPSDWRRWDQGTYRHDPRGINAKVGQTVRMPPLNTSLAVTRNPVIPYGSIANGVKSFARVNPASVAASAAITALFLGLDWVFDDDLDSWMKEGDDVPAPVSPESYHWIETNYPDYIFATPMDACLAGAQRRMAGEPGWNYQPQRVDYTGTSFGSCRGIAITPQGQTLTNFGISTINRGGGGCPAGSSYSSVERACLMPSGLVPLGDADWTALEDQLPTAPAEVVGTAAGDVQRQTGAPLPGYSDMTIEGPSSITGPTQTRTSTDPATGVTTTTETTTQTDLTYGDETITTTNVTTTNTYVDGQHTGTETTVETPGELPITQPGGPGFEWPGFCDWAVRVCDWLDWTQEDPGFEDPDLPVPIDEDFYTPKNISFGSKSCPADYGITVPFINTTVMVPMQPFCDFAGIIYYMVMASAYIYAAYISVGVARNG